MAAVPRSIRIITDTDTDIGSNVDDARALVLAPPHTEVDLLGCD